MWDEPKPTLLGYCFYKLEPLSYLMPNPFNCAIISTHGGNVGNLYCDIIPHDGENNEFEEVPEHPSELIGQPLYFKVYIKHASDLPLNFCTDVYVEYISFHDNQGYRTKVIPGRNRNPVFEEYIEHCIEYLTKEDIEHLENGKVKIIIYFSFVLKYTR